MPNETEKNKSCRITLYLDTPKPLLRPFKDFTKHNQLESLIVSGAPDITALTGHVFVGLTDEKGREERWGFWGERTSPYHAIAGTKGIFDKEETSSPYNEAIVWNVTPKQLEAAKNAVKENREAPGTYRLFERNCTTVALGVVKAAGITGLPSSKWGMTPHALVLKKRWMLAKRRLEVARFKVKNLFSPLFGKEKIPNEELLKSLRSKPLPVPINNGMKAFRQNRDNDETKPLDVSKIIASISKIRS